jgi:isopentenyl diphosphate isomerase/L-lactate dehydrogenase-like FMN-dependent dehydrogenase
VSSLAASRVVSIADLRRLAKRRLPRIVFDYIDGGAEDEWTLDENCRAFREVTLRPRCAVATTSVDLRTTVLDTPIALPFLLAPVGSSRMFYPRGEILAAAAAGAAETIYVLSTFAGCRLEDVRDGSKGPLWFQLYLAGGRDASLGAITRARAAGYTALVVTIDTPVAGLRERDVRNGMRPLVSGNPWTMMPFLPQFLVKPRWLAGFFRDGGLMKFPNVVLPNQQAMPYADVGAALEQAMVCWDDLAWIRDAWKGPIVVKGVHTGDDARRAVDAGAVGVIVSNHGGRQLDGVAATLRVLPEVVHAVGDRADGAGVSRSIEILRTELVRTLKLLGCASVADLNSTFVDIPASWRSPRHEGAKSL